jgi:hypothetical protein
MTKLMLMAALVAGGCSWGAQTYRGVASSPCSTSRIAPVIDTAIAVAGATAFGVAFASGGRADDPGSHRSTVMGAGSLAALVYGASAISGYTWAGDCRRAPRESASIARQ